MSSQYHNNFSWCDWVGILPPIKIPSKLIDSETGTDTISGKYSPTEIWAKNGDKMSLNVDVLADTTSRKYMPNISWFLSKKKVDFEQIRMRQNFNNVSGNLVSPLDLTSYSINIDSRGRWQNMFRFNRYDEPFFVTTYAEVYILDKEFITEKKAKKWERNKQGGAEIDIYESPDVPELQPSVQKLIARVESLDSDQIRLAWTPDKRFVGKLKVKQSFGQEALRRIKGMFGINEINGQRKLKRQYNGFLRKQAKRNNQKFQETQPPPAE